MSADAAFPTEIRAAGQTDLPFIFSTWLKSARKCPDFKRMPAQPYFKHMHDRVAQLLNDARTLVACPANDPDTILGYACGSEGLLHWAYVKRTWRGLGIGKSLVEGLSDVGECREFTIYPADPLPSWLRQATYNPFLV